MYKSLSDVFLADDVRTWETVMERAIGGASPLLADLYDVARRIFLADCEQPRTATWRRSLNVTLPVRERAVWKSPDVMASLKSVLSYPGGDRYTFDMADAPAARLDRSAPLDLSMKPSVCLYSEGLDSLSGLARSLGQDQNASFLAVSVLTQRQAQGRLRDLFVYLNGAFKNRVVPVAFPLYRRDYRKRWREETSQRSRSFLLLAAGAIVALMSGQNKVEVYENGIELLNFPLAPIMDPDRLSRAMHPILLARMSEFISTLTGAPFEFVTPSIFRTKSEALVSLQGMFSTETIGRTVSCLHMRIRPCGSCHGCVIRRLSLMRVGISEKEDYTFDVLTGSRNGSGKTPAEMERVAYAIDQGVFRLRQALHGEQPYRTLMKISGVPATDQAELAAAIARVGNVSRGEVPKRILELYSRYAEEWMSFRSHVSFLPPLENQS